MKLACLIYGIYLFLWILFSFLNPWSEDLFLSFPLYFWLSCLILPLGFSFFLGVIFLKSGSHKNLKGFLSEVRGPCSFFLGNGVGYFSQALSIVASYISGSTFLAGPSMAMEIGFSWILLASIQIPSIFLLLEILGKPLLALKKKFHILNILDFLKVRYPSCSLFYTFAFFFLVSLLSMMVIQLIAAGRIMEGIFGLNYTLCLLAFMGIISFYTIVGGFKNIVFTDMIQTILMLIFLVLLGGVVIWKAGGITFSKLLAEKPKAFFEIQGGGILSQSYLMSLWFLLGIGMLGSPTMASRLLSLESKHQIPVISFWAVLFLTLLVIGVHTFAALGSGFAVDLPKKDTAWILLMEKILGTKAKYFFAIAPLIAIISTVDTFLLIFSSLLWSLIKDLLKILDEKLNPNDFFSFGRVWIILGVNFFVSGLALYPPNFLVWMNLFVLAITQVIFFVPLVLGLYFKRGNNLGVWLSLFFGLISFSFWQGLFSGSTLYPHSVVMGLSGSLFGYLLGSLKKPSPEEIRSQDLFGEIFMKDS